MSKIRQKSTQNAKNAKKTHKKRKNVAKRSQRESKN